MRYRAKILVVDDEADARFLASEVLKNQYEVKEAENVVEAVQAVSSWRPDLVLSDIKMPGEDGIELLKKCKRFDVDLPVVLVTGHADKDIAIKSLKEGAFDFIEKPFEAEELLVVIERAVEVLELRQRLKEAHARSIEGEKLATVGLMAGGIAHEINNPLSVIMGKFELIQGRIESGNCHPSDLLRLASSGAETVARITKIVRSLQSFSRDEKDMPFVDVKLMDVISNVLNLCSKQFRDQGIELTVERSQFENLMIQCRASEITQVLCNLLYNAKDALQSLNEKWIHLSCEDCAGEVRIVVKDSGPGIPQEIREQIFKPFFTTKEVGKGTGLGLAVSIGIVKAHNGELSVDANEAHTTFIVQLPKVQKLVLKKAI